MRQPHAASVLDRHRDRHDDEQDRGQDGADRRAELRDRGVEGALHRAGVLGGEQDRSAPLAAEGQALR